MSGHERDERADELFREALDLPAEEREAWVREHAEDQSLADRVLARLARVERVAGASSGDAHTTIGGMPSSQILERLTSHSPRQSRYQFVGELGKGAQGAVLRVWDEDLRRQLAMKVVMGRAPIAESGDTPDVPPKTLSRFLEEAQITGQLDHPGIVPVHELGVDDEGRVYFTMRLVKGDTLAEVLRKLHKGTGDWTQTRVVNLLLRACEAVEFAHDRRVIHRDIKPANLMVGRYGEVYVMDWGLGRVLDEPETKDVRIAGEPLDPATQVETFRKEEESDELLTLDGDVVGTPAYMAPEQARGQIDLVGPQADVYSLGATLYHALTGRMPYEDGKRQAPRVVWAKLLEGPPAPLSELAPDTPPELLAICEKAMARDMADRYASVGALAKDLRAYLENRVVEAYRTGPVIELRKWVQRNRGVAASLAALFVVLVSAGFAIAWVEAARSRALQRSLDRRSARASLADLNASWPIHPASATAMEAWLATARPLEGKLAAYRDELEALASQNEAELRVEDSTDRREFDALLEIRARIAKYSDGPRQFRQGIDEELSKAEPDEARLALLRLSIEELQSGLPPLEAHERKLAFLAKDLRDWRYADPAVELEYASTEAVVQAIAVLAHDELGIASVERRLALARGLRAASIDEYQEDWNRAIASIRNDCPEYAGLEIIEQLGIVPLRRNPASGLWEFWHVLSGDRPVEDGAGYQLTPETGIVLVLVPGGTFEMGARVSDELSTNRERPRHLVELEPYFLSRYELTIAQWYRLRGTIPNEHYDMMSLGNSPRLTRTNPVESVTWREAIEALALWGLELPTEAQWEYAGRAGTTERYGGTSDFESIATLVNFADAAKARASRSEAATTLPNDGHIAHGAVDAFPPNPWGFQAMLGNVWEWTRDWSNPTEGYAVETLAPATGQHDSGRRHWVSSRGGGLGSPPEELRVTARAARLPESRDSDLGVRPMRALDR